jgi:hypothetical protein
LRPFFPPNKPKNLFLGGDDGANAVGDDGANLDGDDDVNLDGDDGANLERSATKLF